MYNIKQKGPNRRLICSHTVLRETNQKLEIKNTYLENILLINNFISIWSKQHMSLKRGTNDTPSQYQVESKQWVGRLTDPSVM